MTLAFSEYINGKPTHFLEKIWSGLIDRLDHINISHYEEYSKAYEEKFNKPLSEWDEMYIKTKIHTIREDKSDRWKSGNKIHLVINNRTSNRFQFAPTLECLNIQKLTFDYGEEACDWYGMEPVIAIDGNPITIEEADRLAMNDGFEDSSAMCKYFNKDFEGKIIHWTSKKY